MRSEYVPDLQASEARIYAQLSEHVQAVLCPHVGGAAMSNVKAFPTDWASAKKSAALLECIEAIGAVDALIMSGKLVVGDAEVSDVSKAVAQLKLAALNAEAVLKTVGEK